MCVFLPQFSYGGPLIGSIHSLANQDPTKWANLAIIAVETNYDCSKEITPQQQTAPAGTGYILQFTNTLNETDVSC